MTASQSTAIVNALTVDVEDYFMVSAFEHVVSHDCWEGFELRVARNTDRLLQILSDAGVRATFFVLGWVAEREPALVGRIAAGGHEVASHGYAHRLVYDMTPDEFRDDVRRSKQELQALSGQPVLGYRAPSFSVTAKSLWALDVLVEEGYVYDASIFPIHHDRYGIPGAPRHAYPVAQASHAASGGVSPATGLVEIPGSTLSLGVVNVPIGGGGYFRLLPYWWTKLGIRRLNVSEGKPAVFYLHPWEIDPEQPRVAASLLSRFRHYRNLSQTEPRLRRLLAEFSFAPIAEAILAPVQRKAVTPVRQPFTAAEA